MRSNVYAFHFIACILHGAVNFQFPHRPYSRCSVHSVWVSTYILVSERFEKDHYNIIISLFTEYFVVNVGRTSEIIIYNIALSWNPLKVDSCLQVYEVCGTCAAHAHTMYYIINYCIILSRLVSKFVWHNVFFVYKMWI